MKTIFTILSFISLIPLRAQVANTSEEKMENDTTASAHTYIGGDGNAFYQYNWNKRTATTDFERLILFVGHKFNKQYSFVTELELEDAKVTGGIQGGEFSMEQCYLQYNLNKDNYFVAGLFLTPLGILNEDDIPVDYLGNERTLVETNVLPATWRDLGIAYYGRFHQSSFYYAIAVTNGLNSADFQHGDVIREGRFEGRNASALNLALIGDLQYKQNNLQAQISGYYGGSAGLTPRKADSLNLNSGSFGTPVILGEADVQYTFKRFSFKLLGTSVSIPNAAKINRAYANNTPQIAWGSYAQIGYNILKQSSKRLILFSRYEMLDMNAEIPNNGIIDESLRQQHLVMGFNYFPIPNISIKADVRFMHRGAQNPDLIINPSPTAPVYRMNNTFTNIGIAFKF